MRVPAPHVGGAPWVKQRIPVIAEALLRFGNLTGEQTVELMRLSPRDWSGQSPGAARFSI